MAEVVVTDDLVRRLLEEQHRDLAALPIGPRSEGWDCLTVRLGRRLAVRLPRRAAVAPSVAREQVWLPRLAPRLPVAVPLPHRRGVPSVLFPWPWSVVPWFDGVTAAAVAPESRRSWAGALADFVSRLHRPAAPDAPRNEVRGVPLLHRDASVRARAAVAAGRRTSQVLACWETALSAPPWQGPPLWLHGDLHPGNMLVRDRALAAVIDFVDLTAGDPATDLATAWLTFDAPGRAEFRARVAVTRTSDDGTWVRARGWAIALATAMLASSGDDPVIAAVGAHGLAQVLSDPP